MLFGRRNSSILGRAINLHVPQSPIESNQVYSINFHQRWSPRGHIFKSLALASKPQVLGLGLEALGPRKLPCPRLEDSTNFEPLKFCRKTPETSQKICKYLFYFVQSEHRLSQPCLPPKLKFYQ